ncbi:phosphodiester glycosidase family protein [Kitasatospora sp. NPDC001664]
MRKIRSLLPALLVLGMVPVVVPSSSFAVGTPPVSPPPGQMPVGPYDPADPRTWTVAWPKDGPQQIADGIGYRTYSQGFASGAPFGEAAGDHWSLSVRYQPEGTEVLKTRKADADAQVAKLVQDVPALAGLVRAVPVSAPTAAGGWSGDVAASAEPVAWAVRVGSFGSKAEAAAFQDGGNLGYVLKDGQPVVVDGKPVRYTARVLYDALDGRPTTGPWSVRVVTVDPAKYDVQSTFGGTMANPNSVRDMVRASGAVVGINASEGVPGKYQPGVPAPDTYTGDVQGVLVRNNRIDSEANNGRSALVLNGRNPANQAGPIVPARIGEVSTTVKVTATDPVTGQPDPRRVFGVNRPAGYVIGCGFESAKPEEAAPRRNFPCANPDDLTVIRPEWGTQVPAVSPDLGAEPFELLLSSGWVVQGVHQPGVPVPAGKLVLQGIGAGRDWLMKYQATGTVLKPSADILDTPTGKSVTSGELGVVAGGCGPSLLRDGQPYLNVRANGLVAANGRPNSASAERHPRTLVGVTADGKIQMVTVDGRDPSASVGMTFLETAHLMRWLGAEQALSMGCGGDTGLVVNGVLQNNPMDDWGTPDRSSPYERRLPNALVAVRR